MHCLKEQAKREGIDAHAFDAPNAHTDCFVVSGSRVLEGYGKYVVIAVRQKSFNGRIMMGKYFLPMNQLLVPKSLFPQLFEETPIPPVSGEVERAG